MQKPSSDSSLLFKHSCLRGSIPHVGLGVALLALRSKHVLARLVTLVMALLPHLVLCRVLHMLLCVVGLRLLMHTGGPAPIRA